MGETTVLIAMCGHEVPYAPEPTDPYVREKMAKIRSRKCRDCRIRDAEVAQRLQMAAARKDRKISKGQEPKYLPIGTVITLVRLTDGRWRGLADGEGVRAEADSAGLTGLCSKLARRWLAAHGADLAGKVT